MVAEHGIAGTTHRRIAAAAEVPLGATTYYFPSLQDLVGAALADVARLAQAGLDAVRAELDAGSDVVTALVAMAERDIADRDRALLEYELYVRAARDPALQPVARVWVRHLAALLEPFVGEHARPLTMLVDGALLQALVLDEPLDPVALETALRALIA